MDDGAVEGCTGVEDRYTERVAIAANSNFSDIARPSLLPYEFGILTSSVSLLNRNHRHFQEFPKFAIISASYLEIECPITLKNDH